MDVLWVGENTSSFVCRVQIGSEECRNIDQSEKRKVEKLMDIRRKLIQRGEGQLTIVAIIA